MLTLAAFFVDCSKAGPIFDTGSVADCTATIFAGYYQRHCKSKAVASGMSSSQQEERIHTTTIVISLIIYNDKRIW